MKLSHRRKGHKRTVGWLAYCPTFVSSSTHSALPAGEQGGGADRVPERDLVADPAVRGGPLQDHAHPATQRHDRRPQPQPRRHRPLHLQGGCPAPVLWWCGDVVLWCRHPAAQNINYCSSINLCPGHHLTICHACCQDGFELRGEEKTTCVYGNWSGLTPSCQEQYCSFPGYLDNGKVGGAAALLL